MWFLDNLTASDFHYTKQSKCHEVPEIDDVRDYKHVRSALDAAGVSKDNQLVLLGLVAALLHLGNVSFEHCRKENTDASLITKTGAESLKKFCELTQSDRAFVEKALLSRTISTRWWIYLLLDSNDFCMCFILRK
jgi:myosin heavy subunit